MGHSALSGEVQCRRLRAEILKIVQDRQLSSPDLITGLCVVTKRMDTCSPWIVANNPRAPFWHDADTYDGNQRYSLANLVRASTAAPTFSIRRSSRSAE